MGPRRRLPWRAIGFVAVGAALLSALATFLVLSGLTPLPPTHNVVVSLLGINGLAALIPCRRHRPRNHPDRAGATPWPRRLKTACAHRRLVRDHRRGPDHSGRDCCHHHARSRPRPVFLGPHQGDRRKFDIGRGSLSWRTCADDPRRYRRDGAGRGARQAAVRFRPRAISAIPYRPGDHPRASGRCHAERRTGRRRADQPARDAGFCNPEQGHPEVAERNPAADRDHSGRELCRRNHQAAQLRHDVSLCGAVARPAGGGAFARYARKRIRLRADGSAPDRRHCRLRADVYGDRADRAAFGGADRPEFRQPPRVADPPPDRRRQRGCDRQSARPGPGQPVGGRSRAARRDLQSDDARSAHATR